MQLCSHRLTVAFGVHWQSVTYCVAVVQHSLYSFTLERQKHFILGLETLDQLQLQVPLSVDADQFGTVSLCSIVILEGNPHPGAVKGRMSFQNFNPSIDVSLEGFLLYISLWLFCPCRFVFPYKSLDIQKLNEEARGDHESESASPSNHHQDSANSSRLAISLLLCYLGNFICREICLALINE